ncbi:CATRA system-associated protein [Streptomyces sp. NPDC008238]
MDADATRRAARRLQALDDWFLSAEKWLKVDEVLRGLSEALTTGKAADSDEAVAKALDALQGLESSHRAKALPGARKTPISPELREQRNTLVGELCLRLDGTDGQGDAGCTPPSDD